MKKLFNLFVLLALSTSAVFAAENVKVSALENFSTLEPTSHINVKVLSNTKLGQYELSEGDVLNCEVLKVSHATRGKRDASFVVKPVSITANEETIQIEEDFVGGYSKKVLSKEELKNLDATDVAIGATKKVGGYFIKGFGQGISFAQGVVQNGGEKPIRSGLKKVYKDSPLSYVEVGQELSITPDDTFYFVFKEVKTK